MFTDSILVRRLVCSALFCTSSTLENEEISVKLAFVGKVNDVSRYRDREHGPSYQCHLEIANVQSSVHCEPDSTLAAHI